MEQVLLTKEGYEEVVRELDELITVKRQEVAQRIKEAREFGDISENAEYDAAKNEQAELEERIKKLDDMKRMAKIIDENKRSNKVNIGSSVTLIDKKGKCDVTYTLVGTTEADPLKGKISNESVVGKEMLGLKVGDSFVAETPSGKRKYEVKSINKK
ncbi:MAG: transcription elongation factor GreA [Anaerovoracaceae bacterium]